MNLISKLFFKDRPMLTKQKHTVPQRNRSHKNSFSFWQYFNPKPSYDSSLVKKNKTNSFIKRLSPFLITIILLPLIAIYTVVEDVHFFESMWVQLIVFAFIEFNFLLLDYALWNYFCGKKVARIWLIELSFESLLFYLVI